LGCGRAWITSASARWSATSCRTPSSSLPRRQVDVTAQRVGDAVVVAVADTGIGIAEEEREQLFTRFFRTEGAVRSAVQGTGLGLSIVKAIVEAHHGQIGVDSIEGSGSTFRFTLPLVVTRAVAQREATRT